MKNTFSQETDDFIKHADYLNSLKRKYKRKDAFNIWFWIVAATLLLIWLIL